MLLTPKFIGSLLAGIACWLLFWYGISHVDSIPYLNQYLSRKMILEWIRKNPQLALILTELVNIGLHGVGTATAVLFTFGGTLVNVVNLKITGGYTHFDEDFRKQTIERVSAGSI